MAKAGFVSGKLPGWLLRTLLRQELGVHWEAARHCELSRQQCIPRCLQLLALLPRIPVVVEGRSRHSLSSIGPHSTAKPGCSVEVPPASSARTRCSRRRLSCKKECSHSSPGCLQALGLLPCPLRCGIDAQLDVLLASVPRLLRLQVVLWARPQACLLRLWQRPFWRSMMRSCDWMS